jgi:hypothetical protein
VVLRLAIEVVTRLGLSTALCRPAGKHRHASHVVHTDDIHTPVEKEDKHPEKPAKSVKPVKKPPGQFISEELEAETARFIEEVKGLAKRRKSTAERPKRGLPPPRDDPDQRSSRR